MPPNVPPETAPLLEALQQRLLHELLPNLVAAITILVGFLLLRRLLARPLEAVLRRAGIDETARRFVDLVVRATLLVVGLVIALGQLGVNTASLVASLGVAGLTLGFAARDTLANVISGLFIFWDRPFVMGDLVEIEGQYGRVATITLRSTRVVTPDGRMLAIPNSAVVNSVVASYTNFPNLRIEIPVTVGPNEELGRIRGLLLDLVTGDPRYMSEPPARVAVTALNDFNVELTLYAWLSDEREHVTARADLREAVFEALRTAGVDMPPETFRHEPVEVRSPGAVA